MSQDEKSFEKFLDSIYNESNIVEIAAVLKRSRTSLYHYKTEGLPPPVRSHLKAHFLVMRGITEALEFLANEGYSEKVLANMLAAIESRKNESE